MNTKTGRGTRAVWAGEEEYLPGATQVPVVFSAAFGYRDMEEWLEAAQGKAKGHIYTRNSNPTVAVFEEKVRLLEDAEAATSAASGMGIISSTLFALLVSGNRVVSVKDTYGGTSAILTEYLPKYRIDTVQCDTTNVDQIEAEIAQGCTLLFLETPTNPTTQIIGKKTASTRSGGLSPTFGLPMPQGILDPWKQSWPHRRPAVMWNAPRKNVPGWASRKG